MPDKPTMEFSVNLNTKNPDKNYHSSSPITSPSPNTQADSPFRITIMGNFSGHDLKKFTWAFGNDDNFQVNRTLVHSSKKQSTASSLNS